MDCHPILIRALHSGFNGSKAMVLQVTSLMWLRTIMNYQYKYGTPTGDTIKRLYKEGGIRRFYSGMIPALIQGPVSRFGDTFSNTFILNLTKNSQLPIYFKTALASATACLVRVMMTPMDTVKTMSQVKGNKAMGILTNKIRKDGIVSLYHGAIGNGIVTLIGHFPWFLTHNYLNKVFPGSDKDPKLKRLTRNAVIGFWSSLVSDTSSNFMRVIKTYRQTNEIRISYINCAKAIICKDGVNGLLFRGLGTRLIANCAQGLMFNVIWKYLDTKQLKQTKYKQSPAVNTNYI